MIEKEYPPYIINRCFSGHLDAIMFANEMNKYPDLPPEVQFAFMNEAIRKGRRYSAWYKGEIHPNLEIVMQFFNCSQQKALQALQVLTQENLKEIKQRMDTGGR